jgi:hypothetical protein
MNFFHRNKRKICEILNIETFKIMFDCGSFVRSTGNPNLILKTYVSLTTLHAVIVLLMQTEIGLNVCSAFNDVIC